MTRVIMNGCNGHMGQVISELCAADPDVEIVAGVDVNTESKNGYPVFASLADCDIEADAVIDFSHISCVDALLDTCVEKNLPLVLCTTGLQEAHLAHAEAAWQKIPVLKSANMSLGVNLLLELIQSAAKTLAPAGFDMEIVEKHHRRKLDAPSGTALALADSLNEALSDDYEYVFDRSQRREQRPQYEIGISAVRGGNIVGDHDVIFAGLDEVVTFSHTAYSRSIFAKGAIEAAKYLVGKPAGHYDMRDVIRNA
ncbi:MAG: 4-hydroxy-tetrahydrodipicolinate reductase [Eubacterium sp.]|nr:4-hydroxy-tetrahydrodipicolinate reductase [Eubacterium sp.]MBQ9023421.1 4-hydroxy-tetrahydrodipicolinate reductase [Eubacterium sp.]